MPDLYVDEDDVDGLESPKVEVNRNLFRGSKDGFRVAFFLHGSIKKEFARRNLTRDIEMHGGIVLDTEIGCDTVLVDVLYDEKEVLQTSYGTDNDPRLRKVFVERTTFVQHCIRSNRFVHRIPPLKGMGGTIGSRVPFTAYDDECLCHYLARIFPDKASGGRSGLGVYKRLVRTAEVRGTHSWGARHTAESWKERYKKNSARFDEWIKDIVKQEGLSKKQLWPEDRRVTNKALRGRHNRDPEAYSSEGEGEEPPPPPQKRQRSDYSPPPTNRRRVAQPSRDQEVGARSSSGKGKARTLGEEIEDSDGLDQLDSVEISEPGPSRSRCSVDPTNVTAGVLTHRTQPNTASFFTQETVVATPSSGMNSRSKEILHLPDEVAKPSVRRSKQMIRKISTSENEPFAVIDLTSPSGSIYRNSPVIQLSPTRTLVNPSQIQEVQPSTYKRPLKAARRPRAMTQAAVVDAPYRNTRSRSQSVEPSIPNPPARKLKTRNEEIRKTKPALATVDEIQDGQNDEDLEVEDEPMPLLREILADEIDVENMLMSDDINQDEELDDVDNIRGVSLDTDDAQTEQNLRPTRPQQPFSSLRMHPSDILREFQASSTINRYLVPLNPPNRSAVPVHNTQEKLGNISPTSLSRNLPNTYKVAESPRTPLPQSRKNSASSTDSFPISGTRASALKKRLQQQEKRSSYKPPPGTRAAKFAGSRI